MPDSHYEAVEDASLKAVRTGVQDGKASRACQTQGTQITAQKPDSGIKSTNSASKWAALFGRQKARQWASFKWIRPK